MRAAHDVVEPATWGTGRSMPDLLVDLYGRRVFVGPAVVYVHGGAWLMGGRRGLAERLPAWAGCVPWPASIPDDRPWALSAQRDDILGRIDGSLSTGRGLVTGRS